MLREWIADVRTVPEKVISRGADLLGRLQEAPAELSSRRDAARSWLRRRAAAARINGEDRLWDLQVAAIARAEQVIERGRATPGLERVAAGAEGLLRTVEQSTLAPPIEGYDACSVRDVLKTLHTFDRLQLRRIQHYEAEHKNRKTILDAIRKELERRERQASAA
ncbi:MAG TPA: hypothetical protein PKA64_00305 [Myxococcota bacterium]|nr:hypothetical protein [Myxococcota bacterium]